VQHRPKGDGGLLLRAIAGDAADLLHHKEPKLLGSDGCVARGGAWDEQRFVEQVLLFCEEQVGRSERANRCFRRPGSTGLHQDDMETGSYFRRNGALESFTIREVTVERIGREIESGGDGADGDTVEALLR